MDSKSILPRIAMPNRSLLSRVRLTLLLVLLSGLGGDAVYGQSPTVDRLMQWLRSQEGGLTQPVHAESLPPELHQGLSRDEAFALRNQLWELWQAQHREALQQQVQAKELGTAPLKLRWLERRFGTSETLLPLFISMHGGGGAPEAVNDQQWNNQIRLYEPEVGIVVAPRAPTNTWNLWHEGHIDGLFDQLIAAYVVTQHVDPNRVYLMGYSAGGDGVYQLAPRMADRFAAASMMAGHPNESRPLGLRNLPFSIFMGGKDAAYNRNQIAETWGKQLDELQAKEPDGYVHQTKIYPDKGHWMDREDREALPWMLQFRRSTTPKTIVWCQDDVLHRSFYWLRLAKEATPEAGQLIKASIQENRISIESEVKYSLELGLSDDLVDFEKPITVTWNGTEVFNGSLKRTGSSLLTCLSDTPDPNRWWDSLLTVTPPKLP